ncbi:hypothetical protein ACFYNV_29225 [Streptomyces albidoflavus]
MSDLVALVLLLIWAAGVVFFLIGVAVSDVMTELRATVPPVFGAVFMAAACVAWPAVALFLLVQHRSGTPGGRS